MEQFRQFLNDVELVEAPLSGRKYTWSNEQRWPTLTKIDRWFNLVDWDAAHPSGLLQACSTLISYHCPILMSTNVNFRTHRRFHFEAFWPKLPGFMEVVHTAWSAEFLAKDPFVVLDMKFCAVTKVLASWSSRSIGNIKEQFLMAEEVILQFDQTQENRTLSDDECCLGW